MLDCTNEEIIRAMEEFDEPPKELARKIMKHERFQLMINNTLAFSLTDNDPIVTIRDAVCIAIIVGIKIGRTQVMGEMIEGLVKE
jgi:hypothetical protein